MKRAQSQKDESTVWISGPVVWLQRRGYEIESLSGTKSNGGPMRSRYVPDKTELQCSDVESLGGRKSGEHRATSQYDRIIDNEISGALLY